MKIAICINASVPGGVGTSTYILAHGMRKAGHQANILATHWQAGPDHEQACRDGWPLEAICLGQRWLWHRLGTTLKRLSAYDVVINNHSTETQLVMPALPASVVRLSVIRSSNAPVIQIAKQESQAVDALVAISPEVKRLLIAAGIKSKVQTIANAIMVESTELPVLGNFVRILYLGRLTDVDKNVLILPEIARELQKCGLKYLLTVVGDGRDRHRLENKISRLSVGNCVKLVGAVPRKDVGGLLSKSHFTIVPSNYEGFGLVVGEAMAIGNVPIVSDISSFRWILGDCTKPLQVVANNAQAYAERLYALANAPERYRDLQRRLQQRQRENFSPDATVNGYLSLIDDLSQAQTTGQLAPIPLGALQLPKHYKRRCTRAWWVLQRVKSRLLESTPRHER